MLSVWDVSRYVYISAGLPLVRRYQAGWRGVWSHMLCHRLQGLSVCPLLLPKTNTGVYELQIAMNFCLLLVFLILPPN